MKHVGPAPCNRLVRLGLAALAIACWPATSLASGPCDTIRCSDHGLCIVESDFPKCLCEPGFSPSKDGLSCLPPNPFAAVAPAQEEPPRTEGTPASPCADVRCSGYGRCVVFRGEATCLCQEGFLPSPDGLACVSEAVTAASAQAFPHSNPCAKVTCSGHGRCVMRGTQPTCACDNGYGTDSGGLSCVPVAPPARAAAPSVYYVPYSYPSDALPDKYLRYRSKVAQARGATIAGFVLMGTFLIAGGSMMAGEDTTVAGIILMGAGGGTGFLIGIVGAGVLGHRQRVLRRMKREYGITLEPVLVPSRSLPVANAKGVVSGGDSPGRIGQGGVLSFSGRF